MKANPLQEPRTALRFAVDFAQKDLGHLTPRQLRDLERLVQAFLNREKWVSEHVDGAFGPKQLEFLQERTLEILTNLVNASSVGKGRLAIAGDLRLSFYLSRDGDRVHIEVLGSPLHLLEYQLKEVLEAVGLGKLRVCPSTACGRLFLKVTKKEFCSARCQSRTYMQKRRAEERAEKERFIGKKTRTRRGQHHTAERRPLDGPNQSRTRA